MTEELFGVQGLAWTPDGADLVFSGNTAASSLLQPMSVPAAAARGRTGIRRAGPVHRLRRRDGRAMAGGPRDLSVGVRARIPGQETERDLSWLGSTGAQDLSADGGWLLMVDVGQRAGPTTASSCGRPMRRRIRLGEGHAQKLSPDGQWAAAIIAAPAQLLIYPTGPGEAMRIGTAPLARLISADWFPDGKRLLVADRRRHMRPAATASIARVGAGPMTPEGVLATLAPDGKTLLLAMPDGGSSCRRSTGATRSVQGLGPATARSRGAGTASRSTCSGLPGARHH